MKNTKEKIILGASSPIPSSKKDYRSNPTFDFYQALKFVEGGKRITRIDWGSDGWYGFLDKELLKLHTPEGIVHNWIVNLGDMIAEDWVVL